MICKQCGIEFTPTRGNRKYCSEKCKHEHYLAYMCEYNHKKYAKVERKIGHCSVCGKEFIGKQGKKYCSAECRTLASLQRRFVNINNITAE